MSLQITIDGEAEQIIQSELARGRARSAEELVKRALEAFSMSEAQRFLLSSSRQTTEEAVSDLYALRKTVTIDGLDIKALAHEGHRY